MRINHPAPLVGLMLIVTALYPLAVYFGLGYFQPASLALVLFSVLLLRFLLLGEDKSLVQALPLLLVGSLCLLVAWFQSETLLRYYPVLMNLCFAGFFWFSLRGEKSLIERFAAKLNEEFNQHAITYMRGLSKAWALLLLINAAVSLSTACCASFEFWALYNGLVAYIVFAVFTLSELCYRHYYKKRHRD